MPVLEAIIQINPQIEVRVYLRDSTHIIDQFLTNGSKSIPIVFSLNESNEILFKWGPRVKPAQEIAVSLKDEPYRVKQEKLIDWYTKDGLKTFQLELIDLI